MSFSFGLGELYSLACAAVWAVAVILFRRSGESLAPFALNLFKNAVSLALMIATLAIVSPRWPALGSAALAVALLSGVLGIGIGDTLYFRALNALGAGRMAVAQTMYSPGVILLSVLFLGERLRSWQAGGVVLVLAGIALATWQAGASLVDRRHLRIGAAYGIASVLVMAAGVVMAKPLLEQYDFFWIVALRIAGGTAGMLGVAVVQRSGPQLLAAFRGARHWPHVIAGSVLGTYVSMLLWLAGYKYTKASISAVLNESAAIFIIVLAAITLKEHITRRQWIGSGLAVAGVMLVVMR